MSRFLCFIGAHDWLLLGAPSSWGHSTWHKWEVRHECRECGAFQRYMESNEREVEKLRAEFEASDPNVHGNS